MKAKKLLRGLNQGRSIHKNLLHHTSPQSQTKTRPGSGFRAAKMATVSSPLVHQWQTCRVTDGVRERDVRRLNQYTSSVALCSSHGCYSIRRSGADLQLHTASSVSVTGSQLTPGWAHSPPSTGCN